MDFGINIGLVEELFAQYQENPASVDASWKAYFDEQTGRAGGRRVIEHGNGTNGAAHHAAQAAHQAVERAFGVPLSAPAHKHDDESVLREIDQKSRVMQLLNAYRVRGHFYAKIDPLGGGMHEHAELDLDNFGLDEADPEGSFPTGDMPGPAFMKLREIVEQLEETYCRSIGVEFTHIEAPEARRWLQERMEATRNRLSLSREEQLRILRKLTEAEVFERFIHGSYGAGTKRFSLEGGESMIPVLDLLIERAAEHGVEEVVFGMAHRGRLNVLVNIMQKSKSEIFAAFEDSDAEANVGRGDVK